MRHVALAVLIAAVGVSIAGTAKADADTELFGENVQRLDQSLNMRRTTTDQFDPIRGQSVLNRPRPDFDPVPISIGSFQLFPTLNVGTYYDNNIFALQSGGPDDQVWKINPTVSFLSNWGRHAVGIEALGDIDFYDYHNEQNYMGGAVQAEGRYDLAEQTWLSGTTGYQRVTESRGSPSAPGSALGPSQYNLYTGNAEAYRGVGLVKAKIDLDTARYDYSPFDLIGGGSQSQSSRDRTQDKISGEVSYDQTENFKPFLRGGYNTRTYTTSGMRNSDGYSIDAGSKMDFGGIITTEAYVGWLEQDYSNFTAGNVVDAPDFGGDILWNVTELTSIEARVQRSIEETDITGDSSFVASEASVTASHELTRDIVLETSVTYDALNYQGAERHDDLYNVGAGGRYYINRHLYSDLTYNFQRRTSDAVGQDYDEHTIFVRLGMQY